MKMREITEREHKVKHHPLESPSHQKVKPLTVSRSWFFYRREIQYTGAKRSSSSVFLVLCVCVVSSPQNQTKCRFKTPAGSLFLWHCFSLMAFWSCFDPAFFFSVYTGSRSDPLSVTSDLLIFLLLSLICPSLPSFIPANWIVSLQMVLEASPCKLVASLAPPHHNPIFFTLSPLHA